MLELEWEKNLVAWLDWYCKSQVVPNDRAKARYSESEFFQRWGLKVEAYRKKTNFAIELLDVFPSRFLRLDEDQKQSILEYIDEKKLGFKKSFYCWFLCHILAQFEKAEDLENPIAQAINENYQFLKLKYFEANQQAKIDFYTLKEQKPQRPNCVSCGSSNVVSSGLNWVCKDCGRAYRKKPRTHNYSRA